MNSSEYIYTATNGLVMRPYKEQDAASLYVINANSEIQYLWAPNAEMISFEKFKQKLTRRIEFRWDHYRVVERRRDQKIIGFAYCYDAIQDCSIAYICVCIDKPYMNSILSLRTAYLYLSHLFVDLHYRKLYAEVFDYNSQCIRLLEKVDFEKEGCLKQHQWWDKQYWDMHIFALTKEGYQHSCQANQALVNRLSCKTQKN